MGLACTFVVQIWTIKPCFLVLFNGFQWTTAILKVSGMVLSSLHGPAQVGKKGRVGFIKRPEQKVFDCFIQY